MIILKLVVDKNMDNLKFDDSGVETKGWKISSSKITVLIWSGDGFSVASGHIFIIYI